MIGELTKAKVKAARKPGRYADGNTLYLYVTPTGSKSWVQRLTVNGRRCDIGLGPWPVVTLVEARDVALDNRRLVRDGGDPLAEKRKASIPTFRDATVATHEANKASLEIGEGDGDMDAANGASRSPDAWRHASRPCGPWRRAGNPDAYMDH